MARPGATPAEGVGKEVYGEIAVRTYLCFFVVAGFHPFS